MHAVDVDQLEAVGARRGAVPEDVAVVEVPVLDSLFVELSGEAGEGAAQAVAGLFVLRDAFGDDVARPGYRLLRSRYVGRGETLGPPG